MLRPAEDLKKAGLAEGKTLTAYTSVKIDLENVGATWVDELARS